MKDLKNIIYAIIFSTIGGVVSITGYNYMYPRNNTWSLYESNVNVTDSFSPIPINKLIN